MQYYLLWIRMIEANSLIKEDANKWYEWSGKWKSIETPSKLLQEDLKPINNNHAEFLMALPYRNPVLQHVFGDAVLPTIDVPDIPEYPTGWEAIQHEDDDVIYFTSDGTEYNG